MENDIMNKQRRTDIEAVQRDIGIVKRNLQKILDEEQEAFDNIPE